MANVAATVQTCDLDGLTTSYQGSLSTSDTYQFVNDGNVFIHFKKSGATDCTVTFLTPVTVGPSGLTVQDPTVTVPATTGDVMVGPFDPQYFNDSAGKVNFTLSNVTGLTMQVTHLG